MKGIIMNATSVLATLAGNKTQTRLVTKYQPIIENHMVALGKVSPAVSSDGSRVIWFTKSLVNSKIPHPVGAVRYVKEAYWLAPDNFNWGHDAPFSDDKKEAFFDFVANTHSSALDGLIAAGLKKQSPLFMPERFSRCHIEITGVRVEWVQDISDEDVMREGCDFNDGFGYSFDNVHCYWDTPKEAYKAYFIKINGQKAWESNPWVFVYDYKVIWRKE